VRTITPKGTTVRLWSARSWDGWFAFFYTTADGTRISIYETAGWTLAGDYLVSTLATFNATTHLAPISFDGSRTIAVGSSGSEWFVLSKRYDGVVRYADFSGKSCAEAMKELAIVTAGIVDVDHQKSMRLTPRAYVGSGDAVLDVSTPIEQSRSLFGDIYRASVVAKGTGPAPDNLSFEVVAGDRGDSARRLEINSDFITTGGVATSVALSTFQFLGSVTSQIEATIDDDGTLLRPFDRVTLSGLPYAIYKIETDLETHEHVVTLLSVAP